MRRQHCLCKHCQRVKTTWIELQPFSRSASSVPAMAGQTECRSQRSPDWVRKELPSTDTATWRQTTWNLPTDGTENMAGTLGIESMGPWSLPRRTRLEASPTGISVRGKPQVPGRCHRDRMRRRTCSARVTSLWSTDSELYLAL